MKKYPRWQWLLAFACTVPNVLLSGYLLTFVWEWFVVGPLGAPSIGVADGLGLGGLVSWFTAMFQRKDTSEWSPLMSTLAPLALTLFLFGYCALIHAFQ